MELTIILPCYNEEKTIERVIDSAFDFLNDNFIDGEVLVVDNMSTDKSNEIARKCGARVIVVKKQGYGFALRGGIKKARGRYIILGDSDLSYNMYDIKMQYDLLRMGFDAVFGNRYRGKRYKEAQSFLHRYIGVPILSFLGRIKYKCDIQDFHCGQMGFNTHFVQSLDLKSKGFEFSTEVIGKTCLKTTNYIQVPVTLYPDGRDEPSKLNTIRDGFRHLFLILFDIIL